MDHRAGTYRRAAISTVVCQVARVDTIILKQTEEVAYRIDDRLHKATDTADLHQSVTNANQAYATKKIAPEPDTAAGRTTTRAVTDRLLQTRHWRLRTTATAS